MKLSLCRVLLLSTLSTVCLASTALALYTATSTQSTGQTIEIDGRAVDPTGYQIDGNNYFMLRDLGKLMDFAVRFDSAAQSVWIDTTRPYALTAGETQTVRNDALAQRYAEPSNQPIYVNGARTELTAYTIGSNNFVRLRDLGQALGFGVRYDDATRTIQIHTGSACTEATAVPPPVRPSAPPSGAAVWNPTYDAFLQECERVLLQNTPATVKDADAYWRAQYQAVARKYAPLLCGEGATWEDLVAALRSVQNAPDGYGSLTSLMIATGDVPMTVTAYWADAFERLCKYQSKQEETLWRGTDYSQKADQAVFAEILKTYPDMEETCLRSDYNWLYDAVHHSGYASDLDFKMNTELGHYAHGAPFVGGFYKVSSFETQQEREYGEHYFDNDLSRIKNLKSDKEKAEAIMEVICDTFCYSKDDRADHNVAWSLVLPGARLEGKGMVCENYTNVAGWMLRETGIPTFGMTHPGHVWNVVYVDDGWEIFDASDVDKYAVPVFQPLSEKRHIPGKALANEFCAEIVRPGSAHTID